MTLVAVYGTLRRGEGNNGLLVNAKYVGIGKTKERFTMYVSGSIPMIVRDKLGRNVTVELYEVTDETLRNLDWLEGHPHVYIRHPIDIETAGGTVSAYTYLWNGQVSNRMKVIASGDYKRR